MRKPGDSNSLPLLASISQRESTPAQSAAWRRLWQLLLEDGGARTWNSADSASGQQEELADRTATQGVNKQVRHMSDGQTNGDPIDSGAL